MKKIFIIISFLGFISCTDSILDKKPLDMISDAQVWSDATLVDAYLTDNWERSYILVNDINDNQITDGKGWFNIIIPSRVGKETFVAWGRNTPIKFETGGLDINGGLFEWWDPAYRIIRNLNELIDRLPETDQSNDFIKSRVAEARFLRAYHYFALVKRYGGVPIIKHVQNIDDSEEELFAPRDKEEDVYKFILSEIDEILNDLPQSKATLRYGKPTKFSALALKSRAALYAGSIAQFGSVQLAGVVGIPPTQKIFFYQQAYDAASQIIQSGEFSLYNRDDDKVENFKNLFMIKNNEEVLLSVIHDGINSQQGGNGWGWDHIVGPIIPGGRGHSDAPYLEMVEAFEYVDGSPGTLNKNLLEQKLWTTEELWANKDPRFYASIYTQDTPWKGSKLQGYNGIEKPDGTIQTTGSYKGIMAIGQNMRPEGTGFGVLKLVDEAHDPTPGWGWSSTDWIIFRYGEVLLNFAEAAFELSKPEEALNAINMIRKRAGIAELNNLTQEKIRHERKVELMFEGHRYWDLRRWRTATTELSINQSGLRYILNYETGKFKLKVRENQDGTVNTPFFHVKNYYLPITIRRTNNNPNLVENPGY